MRPTNRLIATAIAATVTLSLVAAACGGGDNTKSTATKELNAACESFNTAYNNLSAPDEYTQGYRVSEVEELYEDMSGLITTFTQQVGAVKLPNDWKEPVGKVVTDANAMNEVLENLIDVLTVYGLQYSMLSDADLTELQSEFDEVKDFDDQIRSTLGGFGLEPCSKWFLEDSEETSSSQSSPGSTAGTSGASTSWTTATQLRSAILSVGSSVPAAELESLSSVLRSKITGLRGLGFMLPAETLGQVSGLTGATTFSSGLVGWAFAVAAPDGTSSTCLLGAVYATGKPASKGAAPSGTVKTVTGELPAGEECTGSNALDALDSKVK